FLFNFMDLVPVDLLPAAARGAGFEHLKVVRVAPLAMFAAFAATLLVYWIALLLAMPGRGGAAARSE
ncbi:MAG TPA: hypothetical protein VN835_05515, partial [Steroidobacteraceae bacterium]|nr:hypothetical protein [Steroidobacteraceae bacterium]